MHFTGIIADNLDLYQLVSLSINYRLVSVGIGWYQLVSVGISWYQLVE